MEKNEFFQLLKKYKQGTATNEERRFVNTYYELFKTNPGLDDLFTQEENEQLKLDIKDKVWEKIKYEQEIPRIKKVLFLPAKIAAAALLILATGLLLYVITIRYPENNQTNGIVEINPHTDHGKPGNNKAILILSDGRKIVLDGINSRNLLQHSGIQIAKQAHGELVYQVDITRKKRKPERMYNTLITPSGSEYKVTLADGTKVWLNAGTSLFYPIEFNGNQRSVTLEGEAYFEVAKQPGKSFTVKAGDTKIQVLGTHFNVSAYDNDQSIETTLSEGAIKVSKAGKSWLVKPGEQAISNRFSDDIMIEPVDVDAMVAWKNGLFHFDNTNIEAIMKEVSRWYDVDVVYATKNLKRKNYSGIMSRYNDVDTLLQRLEMTGTVHFEMEGRKLIVKD